jgi:WhiB family redox-sensing transcriptional regulator
MVGVDLDRLIPPRPAWMGAAACREQPEVDFFPGRGGNARPALAICRGCSVRDICLTYGQENGEHGIWGGQLLKRSERRGQRRRKADNEAVGAQAKAPGGVPA